MPGYVCIIGAADNDDQALEMARDLQQKNILTLMCGNVNGDSVTKQLLRKGVQLGWDTRLVPLGPEVEHAIYALNWAARAGITFGGMKGGDFKKILKYSKDKVFAFAMVLGPLNDRIWTTGAGAINMGFPAIANTDIPVVHPTGVMHLRGGREGARPQEDRSEGASRCAGSRSRSRSRRSRWPSARPSRASASARRTCTSSSAVSARRPSSGFDMGDLDKVEDGKVIDRRHGRRGALQEGRPDAARHADRGRRPQDAEGLRAGARAQDPSLRERGAGHLAHGPARPELGARQQGSA